MGDKVQPLNGSGSHVLSGVAGVAAIAVLASLGTAHAGVTVLHAFMGGSDGAQPRAALIEDSAGNLYGTTFDGGDVGCNPNYGCGTVFKLAPGGAETVLHAFRGPPDGAEPGAGLIQDEAGNLYGTTYTGGGGGGAGWGTVFRLAPDGTETVIHSFYAETGEGVGPVAGLTRDKAGNLYGTTLYGGTPDSFGTAFKLAPDGTETVLHAFTGAPDGAHPESGMIRGEGGNLCGTTSAGGANGWGTVFTLAPSGKETVLYSFAGGNDGAYPYSGLIKDNAGNLYGTTTQGGKDGVGTVFRLAPDGVETVLHAFTGTPDGAHPDAGVIQDKSGNLYGTTIGGGAYGFGTVFKLAPDGTEIVLYAFHGHKDGSLPYAGLIEGHTGQLYGTAFEGGRRGCKNGCGTIFSHRK